MNTRTMILKFNEEFYDIFEDFIQSLGYKNTEDYASALIKSSVLNALEELDQLSDSIELEFDEEYGYLGFNDDISF